MPDDSKFDEFLRREMNRHSNETTPPADAIWAAIEHDVARAIQPAVPAVTRRSPRPLWIAIGLGIAATLVVGVALGRWTASPAPSRAVVGAPSNVLPNDSARASRIAKASVDQYLAEAEVFLTSVKADLTSGRRDIDRAQRSRELLARTRLLLASSEPRSPTIDLLLQDLELLLAEVSALPDTGRQLDKRLLDERLQRGTILPRIRTTLPARSAGL